MIGGLIIIGPQSKKVILRALGPSLNGVNTLADPSLQLFNADGAEVYANNDWRDTQETEIEASRVAPQSDKESAIIQTLVPGNYTAVLRSFGETTGLALFEAYDLEQSAASQLVNISTRGFVGTDADVLIGGFTIGNNNTGASATVVIRAIGPSLSTAGVIDPLQDPQLELYFGDVIVGSNDNWQSDTVQASKLSQLGLAPRQAAESALIATLLPGQYTAVVRGAARTTGIGLVEVYNITPKQ